MELNNILVANFNKALISIGIKNPIQEKSYRGRFFSYYEGLANADLTRYKTVNSLAKTAFIILTVVPAIFVTLGLIFIDTVKENFRAFSDLKNKIMKKPESKFDKISNFIKNHKVALLVASVGLVAAGSYFIGSKYIPTNETPVPVESDPKSNWESFKNILDSGLNYINEPSLLYNIGKPVYDTVTSALGMCAFFKIREMMLAHSRV